MIEPIGKFLVQSHHRCDSRIHDQRVRTVASILTRPTATAQSHHRFSLLRVLGLMSLFAGVRSSLFPTQLELSSLSGTAGVILNGDQIADRTGYSVSDAGDVNDDGVPDLVVGAPYADPSFSRLDAGKVYVVFGRSGLGSGGTLKLSNLNGTAGFVLNGETIDDRSGWSVSSAGDVNNDGITDLIIGAPYADPTPSRLNAGKVYVVFGRSGLGSAGVVELSNLNGTTGFFLHGGQAKDLSGNSVSSAGDVNNDGITDLIIGAPGEYRSGYPGRSHVIFGKNGLGSSGIVELASLNGADGFTLNGENADDRCGYSVSGAGDINDDGIPDLAVGAVLADPTPSRKNAGKSYVVFGRTDLGSNGSFGLSNLNDIAGFVLNGDQEDDWSGRVVSSKGDLNGDGSADLIVGAPVNFNSRRRSRGYVVFGRPDPSSAELTSLSNGVSGFVFKGDEQGQDSSGISVSTVGDVNGDGIADLIVGAPARMLDRTGKGYVIFGRKGLGLGGVLELPSLNGTDGFTLDGDQPYDQTAFSVSAAGDVNSDGVADILVGAPTNGMSGRIGRVYIVFGRRSAPTSSTTTANSTSVPRLSASHTSTFVRQTTTNITPMGTTHLSESLTFSSLQPLTDTDSFPVLASSHQSSLTLPLAIAGGLCALFSFVGGAVLLLWCRRRDRVDKAISKPNHEYASFSSLVVAQPESHYKGLKPQQPSTEAHYTPISEVNRRHDEYESARIIGQPGL